MYIARFCYRHRAHELAARDPVDSPRSRNRAQQSIGAAAHPFDARAWRRGTPIRGGAYQALTRLIRSGIAAQALPPRLLVRPRYLAHRFGEIVTVFFGRCRRQPLAGFPVEYFALCIGPVRNHLTYLGLRLFRCLTRSDRLAVHAHFVGQDRLPVCSDRSIKTQPCCGRLLTLRARSAT